MEQKLGSFIWSKAKEAYNIAKHGIDFTTASRAFLDKERKVFIDTKHSIREDRYYCIGKVDYKIIMVRFTYRNGFIRIFGAGCWRKGRMYYEEKI